MTGSLSLAHPVLLWGLLAGLIPVLIHLLLRPRPRRVRFPAVAFMQPELALGQRVDRLRNLLLLLVRAGLLGCAALLLTGPTCTPNAIDLAQSGPVACAVVLDDSLSMRYRPRYDLDETLLEWARGQALGLVESVPRWPVGSQVALLMAGDVGGGTLLTSNPDTLADVLRDDEPNRLNARPLGQALHEAGTLLREAGQPNRLVVVFTDGTASAWRDAEGAALDGIDELRVRVVTPADVRFTDLGIVAAVPPAHIAPATAQTPVLVTLAAQGVGGECWVVARQGAETLARVGPVQVAADARADLWLRLPPAAPGPHGVTLSLEPADLLPLDQQWFVTWQTGPKPPVWLVVPADTTAENDLSLLLFQNLLAPDVLPAAEQRVALATLDPTAFATQLAACTAPDAKEALPALVVVFPAVELTAEARDALRRLMEAGTTVLLVPGSRASDPDWPGLRALLSDALPVEETLPANTTLRWEDISDNAATRDAQLELARCVVQRRVRLGGQISGTAVLARYPDGVPALLGRRLGRGRLLLLTTSPDPDWSELGVRAAGLLAWLHELVDEARGEPTAAAQFVAGQVPTRGFATLPAAELVGVRREGAADNEPVWRRLRGGVPLEPWPIDLAGLYSVSAAADRGRVALYAVNWPAEEFDLTPATREELVRKLGTEHVALEHPAETVTGGRIVRSDPLRELSNPAHALALVLLTLFVVEMVVAVRRRAGAAAG